MSQSATLLSARILDLKKAYTTGHNGTSPSELHLTNEDEAGLCQMTAVEAQQFGLGSEIHQELVQCGTLKGVLSYFHCMRVVLNAKETHCE
jgi:hypothetical protein